MTSPAGVPDAETVRRSAGAAQRRRVLTVASSSPAARGRPAPAGDDGGVGNGLTGGSGLTADNRGPAGEPAEDRSGLPRIRIAGNPDAIRKLKAALGQGAVPEVYVTAGQLVHIEHVSGTGPVDLDEDVPLSVRPVPLTRALLGSLLAEHTYTYRVRSRPDGAGGTESFEDEATPSTAVLSHVLAGTEWPGLPVLAGIIGTPVLRRDFSLLQTPGYDPASGLYLAPTVELAGVPARPDAGQVAAAREFLLGSLLRDFEWEDPASLANYLGLMVTPFLRRPLRCLVPMGVVAATMPGSGKSLLTALIGLLVGQQVVPWPADNDKELEKLITSTFTVESGTVIFDNIAEGEVIDSPILANLLTNPVWSSRILGASAMGAWPNDRLWLATGNNLMVGGDIASRCVYVRLAPKAPHPEERTGFAIGDLEAWLKDPAHRAHVLWCLLVLVADWVSAGTPRDEQVPAMRQFTPWARGVGGFLAHHGVAGFLGNLRALRGMDEEDHKWAVFLATWRQRLGSAPVKVNDVLTNAEITRDPMSGREVDPWEGDFITDRQGRRPRTAQKLGRILAGQVDRYHGYPPLVLRRATESHTSSGLYRVEEYQS